MSTINLTVKLDQTGAIAHRIRYARIDNILNPLWITVSPDVVNSPNLTQTIATNIPNGQYRVGYYAIYSDLRMCPENFVETAPCPGLISINAYLDGNNIIIQYFAPSESPKVKINISYPNGGGYTALFLNNGNDIPISLPSNVFGDFIVTGQSVCDEESGFYSAPSSQVVVTRNETNVTISNQSAVLTVTDVTGIDGYTLSVPIAPSGVSTGSHVAFLSGIVLTLTSSGSFTGNVAKLLVNGTLIQCQAISSGTVTFSPAAYNATDLLSINIEIGACV